MKGNTMTDLSVGDWAAEHVLCVVSEAISGATTEVWADNKCIAEAQYDAQRCLHCTSGWLEDEYQNESQCGCCDGTGQDEDVKISSYVLVSEALGRSLQDDDCAVFDASEIGIVGGLKVWCRTEAEKSLLEDEHMQRAYADHDARQRGKG